MRWPGFRPTVSSGCRSWPRGGAAGPGHKIAKTTPCKVEMGPSAQHIQAENRPKQGLAWPPPHGNFRPNQSEHDPEKWYRFSRKRSCSNDKMLQETMTNTTDDLSLAADFAPATYDDWRKL